MQDGHDLEEGISTRLVVYCASLIAAGLSTAEAVMAGMIEPLTDDAEEAFLTSTVREVQGIAEITGWGHTFADAPGPVTRALAAAFDDLIARDLDP